MKVLFVITKAEVGGAQTSVLNLAREMKARGHEIEVGFGDGDWLPGELDKEKIPYVRFRNLKRTHNPLAAIFFIAEIRKFLRDKNFNVVHFNSSNALFGAIGVKLADRKIKTVFTFRGMSMLDEHYQVNAFLRLAYFWFFKFFLLFVDAPVFVSRENLEKFGRGQLTAKGAIVYNGLDPEKINFFSREEARNFFAEKTKIDLQDKYLIGSIGRLDYAKNYEFLIKIMPEILKIRPDACVIILGEGSERAKYEGLIAEKKLADKIFLLGNIPNGARYNKSFDLFVQTSRYEGLSIALIEALFAGLPIIATDVGGNREEVELEEEIYQLDDEEDFLNKFKDILSPEIRRKIILNNSRQAEKFLLKNTVSGYEKIYGKRR
jgi:glycosyltransferase involved in cell wall biosynthesis